MESIIPARLSQQCHQQLSVRDHHFRVLRWLKKDNQIRDARDAERIEQIRKTNLDWIRTKDELDSCNLKLDSLQEELDSLQEELKSYKEELVVCKINNEKLSKVPHRQPRRKWLQLERPE